MRLAVFRIAIILAATLMASCGGSGTRLTDPDGLVRFSVPAGWEVVSEANGTRLGRIDSDGERTVLAVRARKLRAGQTPEAVRELSMSQIAAQNGELTIDQWGKHGGARSWESLHQSPQGSSRPWMHAIRLFPRDLHVEVALITTPERHAAYLPDLEAVAKSIKPL